MIKVKEFWGDYLGGYDELDVQINDFFSANEIELIDIKYQSGELTGNWVNSALLIYDPEGPGGKTMTEIRSTYYRGRDGQDLFDRFEAGLLSREETIGFYKGNAIKYLIREDDKNGEEDLDKALTYIGRLKQFKYSKNPMAKVGITTDEAQRHVHVGGNEQ